MMGAAHWGVLANAVLFAKDVGLKLVEPDAVGLHIFLVVGALVHPDVGDGQIESRIGVGQHRDPLVGVHRGAVVQVGSHVDGLDAEICEPVAQTAGQLPVEAPGRGLRVAAPEEDAVGVLRHVPHDVGDRHHLPQALAAPGVLGAPVPALPAVGVAGLQRVASQQPEQAPVAAVRSVDDRRLAVPVGLGEDRLHAVLLFDPLDLAHDYVQGFFPGDTLVLAAATVLRVPLAVRVPVHPLQGIKDPIRGVDAVLVPEAEGRDKGFHGRREGLAFGLYLPGLEARILPVIVKRPDADDLAVVALHLHAVSVGWDPDETQPSNDRFLAACLVFRFRHLSAPSLS